MKTILQGWHFMRILRLVLAIVILAQGVIARDTVSIVIGAVFGAMAVANIGCCGPAGCAVNPRSTKNRTEEVQFEEVVPDK